MLDRFCDLMATELDEQEQGRQCRREQRLRRLSAGRFSQVVSRRATLPWLGG
jgi:hypothetical protein